jgi:CRISPR system Cascade subunit CasA
MMMMNIATDSWLPAVSTDGQSETVSLRDLFARAHEIRDLSLRPYERISVIRLLLCISQAALDGPANRKEWRGCHERISPAVESYLNRTVQAFSLFGESQRFLQVADLKPVKTKDDDSGSVSKLDFALATGNNATLFDQAAGSRRYFSSAALALNLVTFQCFSPGGTIGVGLWSGQPTLGWGKYPKPAPGQSTHAPCLPGSMLHTLLIGSSLLETIHLNLLNKELVSQALGDHRWGRPVWEQMPTSSSDQSAIENATLTYLGRLVPLSRAIRLDKDGRSLALANGVDYPSYQEGFREPASTIIVKSSGEERTTLGASLDRAPWRQLHALTVRRFAQDSPGDPLALDNLSGDEEFDLWVGALVADQAKVLDTVESVFSNVPPALLDDAGQRIYQDGVKYSEDAASRLWKAVFVYHKQTGDSLDRPDAKHRRDLLQKTASARFWTETEQALGLLLALVKDPGEFGLGSVYGSTRWGKAVLQAAHRAYQLACPRVTTRQMQAFVIGLKQLTEAKPKSQ